MLRSRLSRSHPNICKHATARWQGQKCRVARDVMGTQDRMDRAGTWMQLLPLLRSLLNPFHCSAVKSTSSPVDHSPPSAAFITKFMMKQFCVLFLHWSRFQGQICSLGHTERKTWLHRCRGYRTSRQTRVGWGVGGWRQSSMQTKETTFSDGEPCLMPQHPPQQH